METGALQTSYELCKAITREHAKSFYYATQFFPPEKQWATYAVYGFCRFTDDLVDKADGALPRPTIQRNLDDWREKLMAAYEQGESPDPILAAYIDTARRFEVPQQYALDLISGTEMDLHCNRYPTFEALRVFCYRVASVVGLMMAHVIGTATAQAREYAIDMGIAMQLTNILRDVGEDLQRERIYLPLEDLDQFNYSPTQLQQRVINEQFIALMHFEIERARSYYRQAEPGIELLSADGRFAVRLAARLYQGILRVIEQNHYDVFSRRATVPGWKKHLISARTLAQPAGRRLLRGLGLG
jgi:phytoene synthase